MTLDQKLIDFPPCSKHRNDWKEIPKNLFMFISLSIADVENVCLLLHAIVDG